MAFNNGLHKKKPETVIRMLNTIPKATVVCTTLLVFSSLLAPISLATMTEAPVAKPVKKPMNRKVREPTPVTAARAVSPRKLPTINASAVL